MTNKHSDELTAMRSGLPSYEKKVRWELADLRREKDELERELSVLRNNLSAAENQVRVVQSSAAYRIGILIINSRSIRGLIRLPWRLYKIFLEFRRNRSIVTDNLSKGIEALSVPEDNRADFKRVWVGAADNMANSEVPFTITNNIAEAVVIAPGLHGTLVFSLPFANDIPPFDLSREATVTIAEVTERGERNTQEIRGPVSGYLGCHAFLGDSPLALLFAYQAEAGSPEANSVIVRISFSEDDDSDVAMQLPALRCRTYTPGISVVLPSYMGIKTLGRCLESLRTQSLSSDAFEVIVILNGPDDGTEDWLLGYINENPTFNLKIIKSSLLGASNARNRGVEAASREYITFIDDDDYVSPNYLEALLDASASEQMALATVLDVDGAGLECDNRINQQLRNAQSYSSCSYNDVSSVLTMNACKSLPTFLAAQLKYDVNMKSGEDVCFFSRYLGRYSPRLNLQPVVANATYYRVLSENSVSRKPPSFAFNVEERLAVIQSIDSCLPFVGDSYKRGFLTSKISAQSNYVRTYLESHRDEIARYATMLQGTPIISEYDRKIAASLSEVMVYSYCFAPYLDTAGIVMAKRIQALGQPVDVVCNSMDGIRKVDRRLDHITAGLVGRKIVMKGRPSFSGWPEIKQFAVEANKAVENLEKSRAPYKEIYSRAMWVASHFAAALHKLRQPEVFWRAEFSDPILKDVQGADREMTLDTAWLKRAGFHDALKRKGITPPDTDNLFAWGETLAYALADEIVFTNSNQLSYMLGYCDLPSETIEDVRKRSVVSHHPTLPALFYDIAEPEYEVDESCINIGYFGSFYATRGLGEVFRALDDVVRDGAGKIKLHVFTTNGQEATREASALSLSDHIVVNEYVGFYDFLALTNKFDCLLVGDANTKGLKAINPYLPSKLSDYLGSNSSIWALCEKGSVLDGIANNDSTGRMVVSYCDDHASHVMALKLIQERLYS
ncbi:glycosyltransferase family 2 protein [Halopseudomonas bauzanensis]|uniref:glycosyltransferase family 2 protein n=1 Tax=Halopseudomonas bauzanensis TaxID=653930 RepID=UPI0025547498|nr:glycosyltransferase family A protein [Halopseudomonas bauzanensis]